MLPMEGRVEGNEAWAIYTRALGGASVDPGIFSTALACGNFVGLRSNRILAVSGGSRNGVTITF
jgi:hypothetical protein